MNGGDIIKRPFVGITICLLAGIGIFLWAGMVVLLLIVFSFYLVIMWKIFHKKISPIYQIFPILIVVGYINMYFNCEYTALEGTYEVIGTVDKIQSTDYGYKLWLKKVECNGTDTGNAVVYTDEEFNKGDMVKVTGECSMFEMPRNPGEFNTKLYYKSLEVDYRINADSVELLKCNKSPINKLADIVSKKLTKSFYSIADDKYASVMCAMLLGNRDDLDEGISSLFMSGGIGHILAISGLHISIIGMGLYKTIKRTGMGYVPAMLISGILIIFYGVMTGNGVSTIRAIIMFLLGVYANVAGRTYDLITGAMIAAFSMLIVSPTLVYNGGFWLSYMAIIGIGGINPALVKIIECNNSIIKTILGGISIQLATIPVVMYLYYEVSVYSCVLNLVVVPLMTYVMISALLGGVIGCFSIFYGNFVVGTSVYILKLYEFLCEKCMEIPGATWICGKPKMWQILIYYVFLYIFLGIGLLKEKKTYILGILMAFFIVAYRPNEDFKICFLDVGQGDGIYMKSGDYSYLVDCGSSDKKSLYEFTLEPFLLSEGVDCIDCVFITHTDIDHTSAVIELVTTGKIKVKKLILPYICNPDKEYIQFSDMIRKNGIELEYISEGMVINNDELHIECLHPTMNYKSNDRNGYSTVLHISYEDFSMLLTGDISEREESVIKNLPDVNLLKIAHHGSKDSSCEEFLEAVKPEKVVISCGINNSYGHPHEETLYRIRKYTTDINITAIKGAIEIEP